MVGLDQIRHDLAAVRGTEAATTGEYVCLRSLNLYQSPAGEGLVTQAAEGRHLRFVGLPKATDAGLMAVQVRLCEDDYQGWLLVAALPHLAPAEHPYQAPMLTAAAIRQRLPQAIAYAHHAMAQPNEYLWGGTVPPNFDCSGLMQAAFASAGIRLPRDSYQQEAFTERLDWDFCQGQTGCSSLESDPLQPGDLIFFGTPEKTTHVALYLGAGRYIHSSGKDQGRNGIGIDSIWDLSDAISHAYCGQIRCAGRVVNSYQPDNLRS